MNEVSIKFTYHIFSVLGDQKKKLTGCDGKTSRRNVLRELFLTKESKTRDQRWRIEKENANRNWCLRTVCTTHRFYATSLVNLRLIIVLKLKNWFTLSSTAVKNDKFVINCYREKNRNKFFFCNVKFLGLRP